MHKEFQGLRETEKAQEELDELRKKMDAITREIRENSGYVELTENIRARERQLAEIEKEVRESPEIAAIAAKNDAAKVQKRSIEEAIKQLPEMIELQEKLKQERDNEKKRAIQEEYNRQVSSRRLSDVAWHKADIAGRQLNDSYREMLRAAMETHPGRKELESQLQQLKENLNALTTRLQTSHPEYTALQKSREAKERDMRTARNEFEQRTRAGNDYKQAESKCSAARKAFEKEKRRAEQATTDEATKLDERIANLQKESNALRDNALRRAGLLGRNPYPGSDAARLREIQQRLKYHTTADWDYRTREEVRGTVPPKMKEWLLRVRGY